MTSDKNYRKKIIQIFSNYCKKNEWGKVNATRALAEYFYPSEDIKSQNNRGAFINEWEDRIGQAVNKSASTTLSSTKLTKLFTFIETYVADMESTVYDNIVSSDIYYALANTLDLLGEKSESVVHGIEPLKLNTIFQVVTKVIDPKKEIEEDKNDNVASSYILLSEVTDELSKKGIYKCTYIRFDQVNINQNEGKIVYRGVLKKSNIDDKNSFLLSGLLINSETNNLVTANLGSRAHLNIYNKNLGEPLWFHHDDIFFRMNSHVYEFPFSDRTSFGASSIGVLMHTLFLPIGSDVEFLTLTEDDIRGKMFSSKPKHMHEISSAVKSVDNIGE